MSTPAWAALAGRFATLATEQEFDLWLYSVAEHHHPPGVTNGEIRFTSCAHLVRERTGQTGLALTGAPQLTGEEFLKLNRFRWLAWAAGRLLSPASLRPELDWLFAVHGENRDRTETVGSVFRLKQVVAASELAARCFSERGCPSVPPCPDGGGLQTGSWQQPLITLRDAFWEHAKTQFDFHLELHGYTNPGPFGVAGTQLRQLQQHYATFGRGINTQESPQLCYWTDPDPGSTYTELAQHAGRQLPEPFIPSVRLLPPGVNSLGADRRPDPLVAWSEFLWIANPLNYQRCTDSSDLGARKAVWQGGNPFMASALAIDQYIRDYSLDTLPHLNRRILEVCPWFSNPEDRAAAIAAVDAAFQPRPVAQFAVPVPRPEMVNLAPGTSPHTLNDICDLLRYRRESAEFMARLRTMSHSTAAKGLGLSSVMNLNYWSALNCPQPPRLTEDEVAVQPTYHWLMRAARTDGTELDEETLRLLVGEVAFRTKQTLPKLMALPLAEFERVRCETPQPVAPTGSIIPPSTERKSTREGGRPKLGEGPKSTEQEKALRNVYEMIRREARPRIGAKSLLSHFRTHKDFKDRVREAGEDFDEPLFRAALAWIKANPDQETESGNLS